MPSKPAPVRDADQDTDEPDCRGKLRVDAALAGRLAVIILVAAAVVVFLRWYGNRHNFFDLRIYVSAMRWWADGHELYEYAQPDRVQGKLYFTYPPFAALVLRPFAELPLEYTIAIFTIGTLAAYAVTTWWLVKPLASALRQPRWFIAGVALPLVISIEPSRETLAFGQINMLLVVLILADLLFAVPRGWRWAGVGIGLAAALKLFPGIFIVYLLVVRRWRAAMVASATGAGATLLAAAVAPSASWQFWTDALWSTERVGRTDYTANQSLQGMLARLSAPELPPRLVWVGLVAVVLGYGLWWAARAYRDGDEIMGMTLTGLLAALISPISWTHHIYWFVPALVLLACAAAAHPAAGPMGQRGVLATRLITVLVAVGVYGVAVFGVVSFVDYGVDPVPTDSIGEFLARNAYVVAALALVALAPLYTRSTRQ